MLKHTFLLHKVGEGRYQNGLFPAMLFGRVLRQVCFDRFDHLVALRLHEPMSSVHDDQLIRTGHVGGRIVDAGATYGIIVLAPDE